MKEARSGEQFRAQNPTTLRTHHSRRRDVGSAQEEPLDHGPREQSRAVLAVAEGQRIATGYPDGSIVLWPAANIIPNFTITEVSGEIRDMLEVDGEIVAVTRDGMLYRHPIESEPLSNTRLARQAEQRLARATELELPGASIVQARPKESNAAGLRPIRTSYK